MRRFLFLLTAVALFCASGWSGADVPEGFTPLFNGKDLSGWKVFDGKKDVWGAEDGMIFVKGGGGGWLMTEKEYGDFEMCFEYRMPKKGNSGVALRAPLMGNPAYQGMEIQLIDDANWEGLRPTQNTGAIYDVVGPDKIVSRSDGKWNRMIVRAKGRNVRIELNGTKIVDANLDDCKDKFKTHPGLERDKGHIGFQSYNVRVDFRNIILKPL